MLKTVSSITNAIGALNFKGTWNASTNTPTLASGVGTKGDYFVVGTAGSTTLDGISTWGVGDWATYNGTVWQRVEGGADLNGVNLSVSGTSTLSGLTASTALALNASKEIVSVTNTGTGNNVLATSPTLVTPALGAATATSINKVALTAPANGSTVTIADGKTLTANNSLTLSGTDATTMTFPTTSATIARTDVGQTFTGDQQVNGNIGAGAAPNSSYRLLLQTSSASQSAIGTSGISGDAAIQAILVTKFDNNSTTSQNFIQFQINNGGANCGKITANGANTAAFGSTSDQRVKENIAELPSQLANIMALRPVEFDYLESYGGGHQIGFIAQEMQQVYPDAISEDLSQEKILSITGWSKTEARLVKAIQEQQSLIESLTARLLILENK